MSLDSDSSHKLMYILNFAKQHHFFFMFDKKKKKQETLDQKKYRRNGVFWLPSMAGKWGILPKRYKFGASHHAVNRPKKSIMQLVYPLIHLYVATVENFQDIGV